MTTTKTRGPVVVGVDFSKQNARAVEYAATVASRRHLPLMLTYALDPHPPALTYLALGADELRAEVEGELADQAGALREDHPSLLVATAVVEESPTDALVDASERASMVVVGSRGNGPFGQLTLGSVAWRVVSRAQGPVVLVRSADSVGLVATGPVVVGIDGSESSAAAVDFAFDEASARGAGVTAVCVWALPHPDGLAAGREWGADADDWQRQMESDADRILSEALAGKREQHPEVHVHEVVVHGINVAQTLLEVASARGAELLVLGAHGRSAVAATVLGSVGVQVAHHAECSVAVVHS